MKKVILTREIHIPKEGNQLLGITYPCGTEMTETEDGMWENTSIAQYSEIDLSPEDYRETGNPAPTKSVDIGDVQKDLIIKELEMLADGYEPQDTSPEIDQLYDSFTYDRIQEAIEIVKGFDSKKSPSQSVNLWVGHGYHTRVFTEKPRYSNGLFYDQKENQYTIEEASLLSGGVAKSLNLKPGECRKIVVSWEEK